ncbi:shikimate dehydrogenase family protein [Microbacterium sp. NPDC089695]|uniref:shikimate dehydrogenase family protein n=1 Tax=Microbacterium sp. NPDC089695 TaxID=3364198 RepID=UPI0037F29835
MTRTRLAVWGDPIAHSRSPQLHAAAYRVLGLDWEYGRRRVDAAGLETALASLDESWRGLSLTMPLKEGAHRVADDRDRHADLTGAVNTLLLGDRIRGFNTDVGGIVDALHEDGLGQVSHVRILGAGATAASALVAVAEMGAQRVDLRARRPERAAPLLLLAEELGIDADVTPFDGGAEATVDLTVATLPGGSVLGEELVEPLATAGGVLFDVAYAPWPSSLATVWPGEVISGLGMLLHQAVRQIRVFQHADPSIPLDDEAAVLTAMRAALGS